MVQLIKGDNNDYDSTFKSVGCITFHLTFNYLDLIEDERMMILTFKLEKDSFSRFC